jgi:hypothetical protein
MAIGVDNVYQQVLAIANKEQRGYITPQEFNLFARKAQNDIFEKTFIEYKDAFLNPASVMQSHKNLAMLREKMNPFRKTSAAIYVDGNGVGTLSELGDEELTNADMGGGTNWTANGAWTISSSIATIAGGQTSPVSLTGAGGVTENKHYRARFTIDNYVKGTLTVKLNGTILGTINHDGEYTFDGIAGDGTYDIEFVASGEDITDTPNSFQGDVKNVSVREITTAEASDVYWIESVYHFNTDNSMVFEEIDKKRVNFLEKYKAQTGFPLNIDHLIYGETTGLEFSTINTYYRENTSTIVFYPKPVTAAGVAVSPKCDYVKTIASEPDPKWGFNVLNGKALYDATKSTEFKLHSSEEGNLINKILELAGISLMKPDLQQSALQNQVTNAQQQVPKSYIEPADNKRTTFLQDQFPYGPNNNIRR